VAKTGRSKIARWVVALQKWVVAADLKAATSAHHGADVAVVGNLPIWLAVRRAFGPSADVLGSKLRSIAHAERYLAFPQLVPNTK
jgi:hypothetical protein